MLSSTVTKVARVRLDKGEEEEEESLLGHDSEQKSGNDGKEFPSELAPYRNVGRGALRRVDRGMAHWKR